MAELIPCPKCPVTLRVPEGAAGKSIRCPKCQAVVPIPAAPPPEPVLMTAELLPLPPPPARVKAELAADASQEAPALTDEKPPVRPPLVLDPAPRKKKKPKRRRWLRWVPSIEGDARRWLFLMLLVLGIAGGLLLTVYFGIRHFDPPTIPAHEWDTVEVPGRFRAKLPGSSQPRAVYNLGRTLKGFVCEPNDTSVYLVGCSEQPLPDGGTDGQLEAAVKALAENVRRYEWQETDRKTVTVGGLEGRQLIFYARQPKVRTPERRIPGGYLTTSSGMMGHLEQPQMAWASGGHGKVIAQVTVAHGRAFVLLAGGPDFAARQENVKRLFASLEVLEPVEPPPPP